MTSPTPLYIPLVLGAFALLLSIPSSHTILTYHIVAAILCYLSFLACIFINVAQYAAHRRKQGKQARQAVQNSKVSCDSELSTVFHRRIHRHFAAQHAIAFCDIGLLFAAATLATGMYWAYHAWGAAWIWEPRLTGMLLMTFFFLSWRLSCCILGPETTQNIHYTAPLLILGLPSMFFTHFATRLMGGIHPSSVAESGANFDSLATTAEIAIAEIAIAVALFLIRAKRYEIQFTKLKTKQNIMQ